MAFITLNTDKLKDNFQRLNLLFSSHQITWSVVSKLLCGYKPYLEKVIALGIRQICDSRISNLKAIKSIDPDIETIFIKPPTRRNIPKVIEFADISFNSEFKTIQLLSEAAAEQNKMHKIVIMIELGELREGVPGEQFLDLFEKVYTLPGIIVEGIGANLTCMNGVLPNQDKLIQLCLYKQLVEAKFNIVIPYISGGASVTIPLIEMGILPKNINHFRVGETLFLGTDVYHSQPFEQMHNDVFKLFAEIIELTEKPMLPNGEFGQNLNGEIMSLDENLYGCSSYRAIIDIGILDVDPQHIYLLDDQMQIAGASSDMIVIDLGNNTSNLKVGDLIPFHLDYMGILRLMHSKYIDKRIEEQSLNHSFSSSLYRKFKKLSFN